MAPRCARPLFPRARNARFEMARPPSSPRGRRGNGRRRADTPRARPEAMSAEEAAPPGPDAGGDDAMAEPELPLPSDAAGDAPDAAAGAEAAEAADAAGLAEPPADGGAGEQPAGEHQDAVQPAVGAAEPAADCDGGDGDGSGAGGARCVLMWRADPDGAASAQHLRCAFSRQRSAAGAARRTATTPRHGAATGARARHASPPLPRARPLRAATADAEAAAAPVPSRLGPRSLWASRRRGWSVPAPSLPRHQTTWRPGRLSWRRRRRGRSPKRASSTTRRVPRHSPA